MNTEEYWRKIEYFINLSEQYITNNELFKTTYDAGHIAYICGYLASAVDLEYCKSSKLPERLTEIIGKLALIVK